MIAIAAGASVREDEIAKRVGVPNGIRCNLRAGMQRIVRVATVRHGAKGGVDSGGCGGVRTRRQWRT